MMNPSPSKKKLPSTLALRVQALREHLDITPRRLAEQANVPLDLVRDIEAGIELFLSPAVRQKLARALRVRTTVLIEVEKRPPQELPLMLDEEEKIELMEAMIQRPERTYFCPSCGGKLNVRIFPRRDLHDNPITAVKVHCTQCLFKMDHG